VVTDKDYEQYVFEENSVLSPRQTATNHNFGVDFAIFQHPSLEKSIDDP
jgi:hypothetical protein